ncbi:MAG: hypothetical protein VKM34_04480 [Cyanobacteriota bacterium]|nr:hypothetical protein [Cyanobacteriota bacterium]
MKLNIQRQIELEVQMPSFIRGDEDEDAAELFDIEPTRTALIKTLPTEHSHLRKLQ